VITSGLLGGRRYEALDFLCDQTYLAGMPRAGVAAKLGLVSLAILACGGEPTGLIVDVKVSGFELDELQYGVSVAPPTTSGSGRVLVDPSGKGRVHGKVKNSERKRQPIYLDDSYAGQDVICEVTGLSGGKIVASANSAGNLKLHALTEITVILSPTGGLDENDGGIPAPDVRSPADAGAGGSSPMPPNPGTGGSGGSNSPDTRAETGPASGGQSGTMPPGSGGSSGQAGMTGGGSGGQGGAPGSGGRPGGSGGQTGMGSGGNPAPPPPPPPPPQKKPKGTDCNTAGECATGFCVDGVCCVGPCIGGCRVCNDPSARGDCRLSAAGVIDPRGSCQKGASCATNGSCDGNGGCAVAPAGTICGPPSCKNKNSTIPASVCDGRGQCVGGMGMMKCEKELMCTGGICR
jgi:hypothetical protein